MDNKICMGIWGNTNLRDRFNINGFGEDVPVLDRIKQIGEIDDVDGIELHLPTELNDDNADEIEKILNDYNLQIVQLCGHTWIEKQYKFGALANVDNKIRTNAIDRVKAALDMGARFNVPISVLWPATDGNDFPLQTDYFGLYDRYVDSVKQIMEYIHQNNYTTKVCIEPKPFEPRSYIMMGTTAQALTVVNEVNDPNFGVNIDIGHSLIAKENIEDQITLICRYNKLYHTHFDDNDQQCDADVPPGTVNFIRLVSIIYVLEQHNYDGWYGLDLFPYRDDPRKFIEVSRDNLRLAERTVKLMREKGADKMRKDGTKGPEMAELIRECIKQA
ncbi:sugar phosphate isomerase/epimerase family protein [candidate division KSB1 bacterium]